MKAFRLLLIAAFCATFTGCETDVPPDPANPAVRFGNNKFRDEGVEQPTVPATDKEKTPW